MARAGTQSIERAIALLKQIALRSRSGVRVAELAAQCELDKGTTQRILSCLVNERLIERNDTDRRFRPGPLLFELGVSVQRHMSFLEICRESLQNLSRQVDFACGVVLRSGYEGVYLAHVGELPLRGLIGYIGQRRRLAVMCGGIAMLVSLPPREAAHIIRENFQKLDHLTSTEKRTFRRVISRSRKLGYAVNDGDTNPGVVVVGLAIGGKGGMPLGALTVGGYKERFATQLIPEIAKILKDESHRLAAKAQALFKNTGQS